MGVARQLENTPVDDSKPFQPCVIDDCGEVLPGEDDGILVDDGNRRHAARLAKRTPGLDFSKTDEVLVAAEKLKSVGNEQFKAQNYEVAQKKYSKTLRYLNHEDSGDSDSDEDDKIKNKRKKRSMKKK
ncbi:hypothetical protein OS493_040012 [Desmophyllum pertusum]|uniref:Uncharacterized protein n=1 Tax=Desmophyllum pertusum TaxID=174260 RepID=A0A9W9YTR9_9CNID|nr:hypothetical protein OS493_040012 [Desmophyllum pertusum]